MFGNVQAQNILAFFSIVVVDEIDGFLCPDRLVE